MQPQYPVIWNYYSHYYVKKSPRAITRLFRTKREADIYLKKIKGISKCPKEKSVLK
jgi:hypothetical protein